MSDAIDLPLPRRPVRLDAGERADKASPGEAKKAKLIRKATALAAESLDFAEHAPAAAVIAKFYDHVPPDDVAERSLRDLAGAALALWRFAGRRQPGQAKIRVYNPESDIDGWSSPHTIVEIVNDDMPFLVELGGRGDQCRRARRPSDHSPDHDRRSRCERAVA